MYKIHIITKRLLIYAVYWTLVFQLSGAWDIQKDTLSKQFPRFFFCNWYMSNSHYNRLTHVSKLTMLDQVESFPISSLCTW